MKRALRPARERVRALMRQHRLWRQARAFRRVIAARFHPPFRLHLGCGSTRLEGWVNIDCTAGSAADVIWDLYNPLPLEDNSCALVYSEHFLEHIPIIVVPTLLRECWRLLQNDGVIRIAMPSLRILVEKYLDDWRDQDWLHLPENASIATRGEMLNAALRWWGHQWLYDEEELQRRLVDAGFKDVTFPERGRSLVSDLRGLERRPDSLLVAEARKISGVVIASVLEASMGQVSRR